MTPADIFADAMRGLALPPRPRIAIGVSGGGDSLALCLLLQDWAQNGGAELLALTVDHGLRAESAAEAEKTGALLAARGLPHRILRWPGEKPASRIQERARAARYGLLLEACRDGGFTHLAVAHNLEDQAETFWMRLAHGSGLDGLAGMASSRDLGGVRLIRPLLGFSRRALREICAARNIAWIEDPGNASDKFLRARLRKLEDLLAAEGLSPQRLDNTRRKLKDARDALEQVTDGLLQSAAVFHAEGYASLQVAALGDAPADIGRRLLSRLLQAIAPQDYAAGFDALEDLRLALIQTGFSGSTLHGCEICAGEKGTVLFIREAGAMPALTPVAGPLVWDRRFMVSGYPSESFSIGALGDAGIADLRKKAAGDLDVLNRLEALPYKVRRVLPALFENQNLVAVPHLSWVSAAAEGAALKGSARFLQSPPTHEPG